MTGREGVTAGAHALPPVRGRCAWVLPAGPSAPKPSQHTAALGASHCGPGRCPAGWCWRGRGPAPSIRGLPHHGLPVPGPPLSAWSGPRTASPGTGEGQLWMRPTGHHPCWQSLSLSRAFAKLGRSRRPPRPGLPGRRVVRPGGVDTRGQNRMDTRDRRLRPLLVGPQPRLTHTLSGSLWQGAACPEQGPHCRTHPKSFQGASGKLCALLSPP